MLPRRFEYCNPLSPLSDAGLYNSVPVSRPESAEQEKQKEEHLGLVAAPRIISSSVVLVMSGDYQQQLAVNTARALVHDHALSR